MTPLKIFYSIIDYTLPSIEDASSIAEAFAKIQQDWVAEYDGFVSAKFLVDTEGAILRAILEWKDERSFMDFEEISDTTARVAALNEVFARFSTKGSRKTFRALGEVQPKRTAVNGL